MFLFGKRKPILKDLIPSGYIDIHSHILPGIDDGAADATASASLLQSMKSFGFAEVIATPHVLPGIWNNTSNDIQETFETNNPTWTESGLQISAAAEYMMDSEFVTLFQNEPLRTLKDNYVLVEMSYLNPPIQLYSILFDLQVAGYKPVLAHPERYLFYNNAFENYKKLIDAGCLLQLNLLSVTGYYGKEVAKIADYLLKNKMYSFSGSDVHHQRHIASFDNKVVISDGKLIEELLTTNSLFRKK